MDATGLSFEWLADLHKSQCFTTCEVSNPARSSDFGGDGFTASLTDWHELLQLTSPDDTCGLVFVRGQFPNNPDGILARAQRRDDIGGKGTLGTRLQPAELDTDLELGDRISQGWINFRWPFTQYGLRRKSGEENGTYEEISFVRDGTVFNIIRIRWGHGSSLSDYDSTDTQEQLTLKLKAGGVIRFGCPCSNCETPGKDTFQLSSEREGCVLNCVSEKYQKRLELQLFIKGTPQHIATRLESVTEDEIHGLEVDVSSKHRVELNGSDPIFIVSTYALRDVSDRRASVSEAHFVDLDDYLGVLNSSLNMTDRLWTALCSNNYEASEAVELCVVGRCVESILSVSSIPIYATTVEQSIVHDTQEGDVLQGDNVSENTSSHDGCEEITEIALLSNIMTPQYVDLQSAFFQIRLLAKVYNFIETRHLEPDLLDRFRSVDSIRDQYLIKLRQFIQSALTWLINTDLKPGRLLLAVHSATPIGMTFAAGKLRDCEKTRGTKLMGSIDQSYNQACYATLAVWYVMKHCDGILTDEFKSNILLPKLSKAYESVSKRSSRGREPTPKNDVLQWLHLSSLFLICNEKFTTNNRGEDLNGFQLSQLDQPEVVRTQQRFEKYVSRLKTTQIESYSIEHEELERVLLLSEELGLEAIPTLFTSSLASSRAVHTRRRLLQRKRTVIFKAGPKPWKGGRMTSNGPWELCCTNHQSFLRVADDSDIKAARDRLFEFLTSDYAFMTSWDRADSNMVGSWWDFEPWSVICATLLDLKMEGKLRSAMSVTAAEEMTHSFHDMSASTVAQSAVPKDEDEHDRTSRDLTAILLEFKKAQDESNRNILRQLQLRDEAETTLAIKAFDWMVYKPEILFHPSWWIQSLHDTPDFYQAPQLKDVPLRKDLIKYLIGRRSVYVIEAPEYTTANIKQKVAIEDVQFLSICDFHLNSQFTFETHLTTLRSADPFSELETLFPRQNGSGNVIDRPRSQSVAPKRPSNMYSISELEHHRNNLFQRLNDSMVDLDTKHRILFAEKCSPDLVGALIYMWHPDALDTVDSYFGATSRFMDNREVTMWTTTITITHWSIRPRSASEEHLARFKENRNNGEFPPRSISSLGSPSKRNLASTPFQLPDIVEERSSSLVITGDPNGFFWVCSIWSSLTDFDSLSSPINFLPTVLCKFIHQQTCSRCLVFLVLLGHLCQKLAAEYELILSHLDVIVGLGDKVLLEGLEWGTAEAVEKLKKLLWGLEALRVFDDRLSASLAQVQKAQEAMERVAKQGPGQQHVDLLQEYNNIIEEFEKRFSMLSDVHIATQLKISQITGLRDGISTVTNVEDSQTALRDSKTTIRQGNNIRMLTYITIAYLPLGFITGLFSIEHASFMDHTGNGGFAVLVVVFMLGTYALALSLESIIDQWTLLKKDKWGVERIMRNSPSHHEDDSKLSFNNTLSGFWGFRIKGRGEGRGEMF